MRFPFLIPQLAGTNIDQGRTLPLNLAQWNAARLSPDQLEHQLNLARGRGCGPDDAGVGRLERIVRVVQKIWRCKVGVIQDVEKLRTKLHPESFSEGKVLEQGEIYGR